MAEAEKAKAAGEAAQQEYRESQRELEAHLTRLESDHRALMDAKRREAEEVIASAREEFKKLINALKVRRRTVQAPVTDRMEQVGSELIGLLDTRNNEGNGIPEEQLEPGRWVYHRKLKQRGVVESVDLSANTARVVLGTMKISATISDLQAVNGEDPSRLSERTSDISWSHSDALPRELNVVGYRVDDALPLIERAMDAALVKGDGSVRIIHGFGTGRLKQAIREHLKKFSFVKDVHSADSNTGGDAITVVELI
jgi:DNA mismatch repair protein MutS2